MSEPQKKDDTLRTIGEITLPSVEAVQSVNEEFQNTSVDEILARRKSKAAEAVSTFKKTTAQKVDLVQKLPDAKEEDKKAAEIVGMASNKNAEEELQRLRVEVSVLETQFKNPDVLEKDSLEKKILAKEEEIRFMEKAAVRESVGGGFVDLATHGEVLSHKDVLKEMKAEAKAKKETPMRVFHDHEPVLVMGQSGILESGWQVLSMEGSMVHVCKIPTIQPDDSDIPFVNLKPAMKKVSAEELASWNPPVAIVGEKGAESPKSLEEIKPQKIEKPKGGPEKKDASTTNAISSVPVAEDKKGEEKKTEKPKVMTEAERTERLKHLEDLISAAEVLGLIQNRDQLSGVGDLEGREREMEVLGLESRYSEEVIQSAADVYRARLNYEGKFDKLLTELKEKKEIKKLSEVKEERMRLANLVVADGLKKLGIALEKNEQERLSKNPTEKGKARLETINAYVRNERWRQRAECEVLAEYGKRPGLVRRGFYAVANMSPKKKVLLAMGIGALGGAVPGLVGGLVGSLCGIGTQKLMNKWMKGATQKDQQEFTENYALQFRALTAGDKKYYYDQVADEHYDAAMQRNFVIAQKLNTFYDEAWQRIGKRANVRRLVSSSASLLVGAAAGGAAGWSAATFGAPGWSDIHHMIFGNAETSNAMGTSMVSGKFEPIVAKKGDSIWTLLKKDFMANDPGFKDYPVKLQNYIIDAYKDGVVENPKVFGLTDANIIQPGFGKELGIFINDPSAFRVYSGVVLRGARFLGIR